MTEQELENLYVPKIDDTLSKISALGYELTGRDLDTIWAEGVYCDEYERAYNRALALLAIAQHAPDRIEATEWLNEGWRETLSGDWLSRAAEGRDVAITVDFLVARDANETKVYEAFWRRMAGEVIVSSVDNALHTRLYRSAHNVAAVMPTARYWTRPTIMSS